MIFLSQGPLNPPLYKDLGNQEWIFLETQWDSLTLVVAIIPQWIPSIKLNINNAWVNQQAGLYTMDELK